MSDSELAQARQMWDEGVALWFIAETFGYTKSGFYYLTKRLRWQRPDGFHEAAQAACRWQPTPVQLERLVSGWEQGVFLYKFSDEFGVAAETIKAFAGRIGLKPRSKKDMAEKRRALPGPLGDAELRIKAVAKLLNHGIDKGIIAEHVGVSSHGIKGLVTKARKRGLIPRSQRRVLSLTASDEHIIREGYRMGLFHSTVGFLIDPSDPIKSTTVNGYARKLGIRSRNTSYLLKMITPEQLFHCDQMGIDPIDRVQTLFRNTRKLTEEQAVRAIFDYMEAFKMFPDLSNVVPTYLPRVTPNKKPRDESQKINETRYFFRSPLKDMMNAGSGAREGNQPDSCGYTRSLSTGYMDRPVDHRKAG